MQARKKEIFKDSAVYIVSSYGAQFFDLLNGILIRRFLGPTSMGIWAFLQVILNYAKHSGLGITTATARDVPYFLGKGEEKKAEEVKNLVFSFTLVTATLTALGVALFAWINRFQYSKPIAYGLFVVSVLIILQRLYNLFVVLLRAHKEFIFAGALNFLSSLASVLFTLLLTWKFKLYGFFVGLVLHFLLMIAFILKRTRYRFSFYFSGKALLPLLSLGVAMLVFDILKTISGSIDRILITKYMGFEALGIYSIALMASNYLYSLPNMLGVIFFPHFQEVFSRRDDSRDLKNFLKQPTLGLAFLFPLVIGFVWILASWFVPILLPAYTAGIPALKYLCLGAFFTALTHPFSTFIITVKKHWQLVPLQAMTALFGFVVTWLFIRKGWGIEGVAIAGILIAFVNFLILSLASLKEIETRKDTGWLYLKVIASFTYFSILLLFLDRLFLGIQRGFFKAGLELTCFFLFMTPFILWAEKEVGVVSMIRSLLSQEQEPTLVENLS